jgi:hypothetical protein
MGTNVHVVRDLAQIVEFGAGVYIRFIKSPTIDATICTNFDIGLDSDSPDLRDLEMTFAIEDEPKSVGPDDDASVKNYPISDL